MGQANKITHLTKKHDKMVLLLQCLVAKYGTMEIDLATAKKIQAAKPDQRRVVITQKATSLVLSNKMPPPIEKEPDNAGDRISGEHPDGGDQAARVVGSGPEDRHDDDDDSGDPAAGERGSERPVGEGAGGGAEGGGA